MLHPVSAEFTGVQESGLVYNRSAFNTLLKARETESQNGRGWKGPLWVI